MAVPIGPATFSSLELFVSQHFKMVGRRIATLLKQYQVKLSMGYLTHN
jgi:ribosomal protein S18